MSRRRLGAAVDSMRRGEWRMFRMTDHLGLDVHGATLGLVGYGQIGRAVAKRAAGFGLRVQHYHYRGVLDSASRVVGFEELLRTSDIVPMNAKTRNMIAPRELAMMKETATLVHTSRGGAVDEKASARQARIRWRTLP